MSVLADPDRLFRMNDHADVRLAVEAEGTAMAHSSPESASSKLSPAVA